MPLTIVERVKSRINDDFISQLSSGCNEPQEKVKKFMDAGIPAVLAFLLGRMETADGANTVQKMAVEATAGAGGNNTLPSTGALQKDPATTNIMTVLNRLFRDRWTVASNMIAEYAGLDHSSSASLLAPLTTVTLAEFGSRIKQDNLSAPESAAWLLSEKDAIVSATPPGFNLAGAIGLSSVGSLGLGVANMSSGVKKPADSPSENPGNTPKGSSKWIFPALVIVALFILLWYFLNR